MPKLGKVVINLPDTESDICKRLKNLRLENRLSQKEMASIILGIPSERYRSFEYLRAPIKYKIGDTVCRKFGINQRWFATGLAPKSPYVKIPNTLNEKNNSNALFSEIYQNHLKNLIDTSINDFDEHSACNPYQRSKEISEQLYSKLLDLSSEQQIKLLKKIEEALNH